MLTPHCEENEKSKSTKEQLKDNNKIGISLSNCSAIEIIDDKYKVIFDNGEFRNIKPFVKLTYWNNNKYIEKNLTNTNNYESIEKLTKN